MNQSLLSYELRCLGQGKCPECGAKVTGLDSYCPKHRGGFGGQKGAKRDLFALVTMGVGFRLTRGFNLLFDGDVRKEEMEMV